MLSVLTHPYQWAMKKAFTASLFLLKFMSVVILDMTFNLFDAFLQMFFMCD